MSPKDMEERFKNALSGAERIKEITQGLGTFSRVEQDRVVPVDIQNTINCAVDLAFNEIKYRAHLVKEFEDVPKVTGSEGRISQVFLNLLVNAAHALDDKAPDRNEIVLRTWQENGEVCAEVKDTGRGIPEENLKNIFEPFFTTKEAGRGSGLGLAISKNIITGYGGRIEVKSRPEKGTSFLIRLPVAKGAPKEEKPSSAEMISEDSCISARILVVDDEPCIRTMVRHMLDEHEVIEAESGIRGQEMLDKDRAFDLIICDMMMPSFSGMDLYDWLCETHPQLAARLLFITGGAFTSKAREYISKAKNRHIEKPFTIDTLRKKVSQIICGAEADN